MAGENTLSKKRFSYFNFHSNSKRVGWNFSLFLKPVSGMRNLEVINSPVLIRLK